MISSRKTLRLFRMHFDIPIDRVMTEQEVMLGFELHWTKVREGFMRFKKDYEDATIISVSMYQNCDNLARTLAWMGFPIHHTGIIYMSQPNNGWDFGTKPEVSFGKNGVFFCPYGALESKDLEHQDSLIMGYTTKSREEIEEFIESMKDAYAPGKYHLTDFNCHTFCNDLLARLDCAQIPSKFTRVSTKFKSIRKGTSDYFSKIGLHDICSTRKS